MWFLGTVALVVVDSPGEGGDGHDQGGQRDRVEEPVRALLGVERGQGGLDLGGQVRAEVGGQDHSGGLEAGLRALPASAGQRVALSQLARVTALSAEITGLEKDLAGLVTALVPELLAIPGVAVITAAKIIGEAGDIRRFRSPAAFARHNGTAPVPASSGTGTGGPQRLNRSGNRQLNAALHRIAVVQARCHPGATALLERRGQDKHETRKASLRVLKRHLSDVIYRAMNADAWRLDQPAPHAA